GKRKLAYEVKHQKEGAYVLQNFQLDPNRVGELEASLKITEEVLRHLIVRKPEIAVATAVAPPPAEVAVEAVASPATADESDEAARRGGRADREGRGEAPPGEPRKRRNLNKALLIGRLTKDPEMRYTPSGTAVTNFSIATNRWSSGPEGERKEFTDYHNIVAYNAGKRNLAEIVAQYTRKGALVFVEGRIQTRSWEGQDG